MSTHTSLTAIIDGFRYRHYAPSHLAYNHLDRYGKAQSLEKVVQGRLGQFMHVLAFRSEDEALQDRFPFSHSDRAQDVEDFPEYAAPLKAEVQAEQKANQKMKELLNKAIDARSADILTEDDISATIAFGPFRQQRLEEQALYRDRNFIDEAGGLEGWYRDYTKEDRRKSLDKAVSTALSQEDWLKTTFRICLDAAAAPTFPHLDWLLAEGAYGRIAVMSEAELRIATERCFYVAGSKFEHPSLGKDDGNRGPSDRNGAGMTTTPLLGYWPEHSLARTVSRFYLLPNGLSILPRHQQILDAITQASDGELLKLAQADDEADENQKSYEFRDEMAKRVTEAFVAATEWVSRTESA
ncbi:MAG: hypothetical protein ACPG1C_08570 [Alphaproteobacteria bacterium]